MSAAVIEATTELRAISRNGVGTDNLPMDAVRARGIAVRTANGANAIAVAELAIGLMLGRLAQHPGRRRGGDVVVVIFNTGRTRQLVEAA